MPYQYKMVQIPQNIKISAKADQENIAAIYLEATVNQYALEGWDFYRVDTVGVLTKPGCLAGLFGKKMEHRNYYVVTFRKEIDADQLKKLQKENQRQKEVKPAADQSNVPWELRDQE